MFAVGPGALLAPAQINGVSTAAMQRGRPRWVRLGRADHLLGARIRDRCSSLSGPISVRSDRGSHGPAAVIPNQLVS